MSDTEQQRIPNEIYIPLVDSLFKEARSLLLGTLFSFLAMVACYWKTGAWLFLVWAVAFCLVAAVRFWGIREYNRSNTDNLTREDAERWERFYVAGATASVSILSTWCFLAFAITTEPFVQLISFSMTIGYIIGIFGRNFGNSKFATIQTFCAWLPMTAALLLFGDIYHLFFAALLTPLFLAVKYLADRIRSVLLDAIVARSKAEAALKEAEAEATKARKARSRVLDLLARLRQSRRSEEAAIATRDQHMRFLATMSHEIRTPLNGIVGALELMSTSRAEKVPVLLKTATASADALLDLVSEVLDLAKLDYGEGQLEHKSFNVADLVEIVQLALAPIARGKGLSLDVRVEDDVPAALMGDAAKVRQVLINLVGNALKFTNEGSVSLTVRMLCEEDRRANIEFEVRDTGVGISAENIKRIYGPFFTGKQYQRDTQSSGLGLAIVQKAIELMSGTINCESEVGVGTTFKMRLTLEIDDNPALEVCETKQIPTAKSAEPARILLVEDNDTNAMIVEDMLEDTAHTVERATGGLEAVRMGTESDYDIILMDISMPDIDGMTACERIRSARGSDLTAKIVALTANAVVGDRERFLENGFDGYLTKPIRKAVLREAIDNMLAGAEAHQPVPEAVPEESKGPALDAGELAAFIEERSPDRACRLLGIFSSEMTKHKANIEAGYEARSIEKVQHSLHSIVGMAGSVGAVRLSSLARTHEENCRSGVLFADAAMSVLMDEISSVIDESAQAHENLSQQAA